MHNFFPVGCSQRSLWQKGEHNCVPAIGQTMFVLIHASKEFGPPAALKLALFSQLEHSRTYRHS